MGIPLSLSIFVWRNSPRSLYLEKVVEFLSRHNTSSKLGQKITRYMWYATTYCHIRDA
jgi:hypothetical protein